MKDKSHKMLMKLLNLSSAMISDFIKLNAQILRLPTEIRDRQALDELIARADNRIANLEVVEVKNIPSDKVKEYCNSFDPPIPYMETIITGKEHPIILVHKDDYESVSLFVEDYWKKQNENRNPYDIVKKMEERAEHLKDKETLLVEAIDDNENIYNTYKLEKTEEGLQYYALEENEFKSLTKREFELQIRKDVISDYKFHLVVDREKEKVEFKNSDILYSLYKNETEQSKKDEIKSWIDKGSNNEINVDVLTCHEVPIKDIEAFAKQNDISILTTKSINKNNPYVLVDEKDAPKVSDFIKQHQKAHGYKRSPEQIASSIREQTERLKDKEQLELKIVNNDGNTVDILRIKKNAQNISYEALNKNGKFEDIGEAAYLNRLKNSVREDFDIKLSFINNRKKEEKEKNEILKKVYEKTTDKEKKVALQDVYAKVEDGNTKIDVIDTTGVPFNEIEDYAKEHNISVFSTQVLGVENQSVIVETKDSQKIQDFVDEYIAKEQISHSEDLDEKERVLHKETSKESETKTIEAEKQETPPQQDVVFEEQVDDAFEEKKKKKKEKDKRDKEKREQEQKRQQEQSLEEYTKQQEQVQKEYEQRQEQAQAQYEQRQEQAQEYYNQQQEQTQAQYEQQQEQTQLQNQQQTYSQEDYNLKNQQQVYGQEDYNLKNQQQDYTQSIQQQTGEQTQYNTQQQQVYSQGEQQTYAQTEYNQPQEYNSSTQHQEYGQYQNNSSNWQNEQQSQPRYTQHQEYNQSNSNYARNSSSSSASLSNSYSYSNNYEKYQVENSRNNNVQDFSAVQRLREETEKGWYIRDSSNSSIHSGGVVGTGISTMYSGGVIGTGSAIPSEPKPSDSGMRLTDTNRKCEAITQNSTINFSSSSSSYTSIASAKYEKNYYQELKIKDSTRLTSAECTDSNSYKMSAMSRASSFNMPTSTLQAVTRFMMSPVTDEFEDLEAVRQIRKLSPFITLASSTGALAPATIFRMTSGNQLRSMYKKGDFESINSLLKKNNLPEIMISDKKSINKSMNSLFGKGGTSGSLSKLGIDVRKSPRAIEAQLIRLGMSKSDASKSATILINAKNQNFLGKTSFKNSSAKMMRATGQLIRMSFNNNPAAQEAMASLQTSYNLLKTAYAAGKLGITAGEFITRRPRKFVNEKVVKPTAQVINRKLVQPTAKKIDAKIVKPISNAKNNTLLKINNSKPVVGMKNLNRKVTTKTKQVIQKVNPANHIKKAYIKKVGITKYNAQKKSLSKAKKALGKVKDIGSKVVNKVSETILKIINVGNKIKTLIIIAIAGLFILLILAAAISTQISIICSTIVGFFEYDDVDKDNIYETITGLNYIELLKQDKQWVESLTAIGVRESSGLFKSKTYVTDLQYTNELLDIADYCANQGLTYDASSKSIRGPEPFTGAPEEAYKYLKEIDGGSELTFVNGSAIASAHTNNIQEILSMSATFFKQNYDKLNDENDKQNLFQRCFNGLKKLSKQISNFKKNIKGKWNDFISGTLLESFATVSMTTKEDLIASYISGSYCSTLYTYSHKEYFELYDIGNYSSAIKPLSGGASGGDGESETDGDSGPITVCTKGSDGGCMKYESFFYNDAGEPCTSQGGAGVQFVCGSYTVVGTKCTEVTDEEKDGHPCWEKTTTPTTIPTNPNGTIDGNSVTPEEGATQTVETTTYTHKCAGGHTIKYCGGHITLRSNATIYTFTDAQLTGQNIVGYAADDADEIGTGGQYTALSVDEDKLKNATDLFGIDSAIKHLATPSDWEGWTAENMEWAINIYNQDWYELYGLAIGKTAGVGDSSAGVGYSANLGSGMTREKLCEELSKITGQTIGQSELALILAGQYTGCSINPANLRVIADALSFVGALDYNQAYHGSPFPDSGKTDCSGFVSNIWMRSGSNIGLQSTAGLIGMSSGSNYSSLQPGDIVVYRQGGKGHTMMFERITEDGKYVFVHSTVFPGMGKNGPGSIFMKECDASYLSSKGYKVVHFQDYYSGSFTMEIN